MASGNYQVNETGILPKGLLSDFEKLNDNFSRILENGIDDFFPDSKFEAQGGAYAEFVMKHSLNREERLLILLSLMHYINPSLTDQLKNERNDFRLVQCSKTGLMLPTGETFLKLVSAKNTHARIEAHRYFSTDHLFYRKSVIEFGETNEGVAAFFGVLKLTPAYRELFLYNKHTRPRFSQEFPAHLLETKLCWEDLVINPVTADKVAEIRDFLDHGNTLREEWGLKKHMKPGYRCLFYGPSGTGKTLAASLLGKHIGREVYRVDISSVISKYIGETAKNLNSLFNTAEDKDWILFFDEGDALFGKRVDTSQSEDKNSHFANQDIAYLLQRIENYNGLVIVASNFRKNMDDAFSRRFQNIVHFDLLNHELSKKYWLDNFPKNITLASGIDFDVIVKRSPLSPASIINVINRVCLKTIRKGSVEISSADLELCIKDEQYK
jgi:hypothetical protein